MPSPAPILGQHLDHRVGIGRLNHGPGAIPPCTPSAQPPPGSRASSALRTIRTTCRLPDRISITIRAALRIVLTP
ncbi:hypothetical protein [Methylobacterium sp. P5_C11]